MAPYTKTRQDLTGPWCRQLSLVYSDDWLAPPVGTKGAPTQRLAECYRYRLVNELVAALMCRLWIPQGTTIVGLLEVGPSKSNGDEARKWVEREIEYIETEEPQRVLADLSRRFLRIIDDRMTDFEFVGFVDGTP